MICNKMRLLSINLILILILQVILPVFSYAAENVASSKYRIKENYITRILAGETVGSFLENITNLSEGDLEVYKENTKLQSDDIIGTGMVLKAQDKEYTIVVMVDINGDGRTTALDLSNIKRAIIGIEKLEKEKFEAADMNEDDRISAVDLSRIKTALVGGSIPEWEQEEPKPSTPETPSVPVEPENPDSGEDVDPGVIDSKIPEMTRENSNVKYTPNTWTNKSVDVEITTTTEYKVEFKVGVNGIWSLYNFPISIQSNSQVIYARFTDGEKCGNITTINVSNIDNVAPVDFSFTYLVGLNDISITGHTLDKSGGDHSGVSGIRGYQYKLDDNEWTDETLEEQYVFIGLMEGTTHTISMRAVDNAGNITEATNKGVEVITQIMPTNEIKSDGSFDKISKVNSPDTSKLNPETTKYVTWSTTAPYTENLFDTAPSTWYDYESGKWANIKTVANGLEAYWVWIPRFAYKLAESKTQKAFDITFIEGNGKTGVNGESCYYATDEVITKGGTGLYKDKTEAASEKWIVHPAFVFGDMQLNGIWIAKYEASSTNPDATEVRADGLEYKNGGGNNTSLKVQVKPGVKSWVKIQLANAFEVCTNMSKTGGAVESTSQLLDTHMAKNIDWGAATILSTSKYGIYREGSSNLAGVCANNNPEYVTGYSSVDKSVNREALLASDVETYYYNTEKGVRASTTGTVYGIYDMCGGVQEYVMGMIAADTTNIEPIVGRDKTNNSGFTGKLSDETTINGKNLPDKKYYDLYSLNEDDYDNNRGKIGDVTSELMPICMQIQVDEKTTGICYAGWNLSTAVSVFKQYPVAARGGDGILDSNTADIFASNPDEGSAWAGSGNGFRPVMCATK